MTGGFYINRTLISGRIFSFNIKNVLLNTGFTVGCILICFLLYIIFKFISGKMPKALNYKAVLITIAAVIITAATAWYARQCFCRKPVTSSVRNSFHLKDKPNVILITMDTTRADHLSCYGYHRMTTPNLDKISKDFLLFKNAYSTSSWTLPSHASIFTGLYPSKHGAHGRMYKWKYDLASSLNDKFTTLAEVLRKEGYKTAGVIGGPYCSSSFGLAQGFDYYNEDLKNIRPDLEHFLLCQIADRLIILFFAG
jgi:hypothetical protein